MYVPLNEESIKTITTFFEMNSKGKIVFSDKKQKEFLSKLKNPDGSSPFKK